MSVESAREFISRILEDSELVERLRSAQSPDERESITRDAGYQFDCHDLRMARDEAAESGVDQLGLWPPGGPRYGIGNPWPR